MENENENEIDTFVYIPFIYNILDSIIAQNDIATVYNDMLYEEACLDSMDTFQNELFRRDRSLSISDDEFTRRKFNSEKHRNTKCFICMEDYKEKEIVLELHCGHVHHPKCIKKAIQYHAICPICKEPIKTITSNTT
jgi:hypothetical protein